MSDRPQTRGRTAPSALPPSLAEAKIAVPAVRRVVVDRPRLRRLLDEEESGIVLVAAPPGYGKTTLVRAWCATLEAGLAWVTLDAGDNDPLRLWRYIAAAVDRVRPGLGRTALQRLEANATLQDAVDELINGIAAYGASLVLVLGLRVRAASESEAVTVAARRAGRPPGPPARRRASPTGLAAGVCLDQ